ncbi:MAG: CPBP family intramembrane glutamic endopeptidase [Pseudolysinimonas sp.]
MNLIPPLVRWGIPDAVAVFLVTPLYLGIVLGLQALGVRGDSEALSFALGLLFYAALAGVVVVASRARGQRSLRADFGLAFKPVDLAIGLGIAVLAKIATVVFGIVVYVFGGELPKSGNFVLGTDPLWIVLTGVLLGSLIAPFVEELVFRGLILRAVRYRVLRGRRAAPHPHPAPQGVQVRAVVLGILISSTAFAVLHLYQAPGDPALFAVLALSTFTVGVFHAVITVVTGRLGPAIVSHILFNGSGVVLQVLLAGSLPGATT